MSNQIPSRNRLLLVIVLFMCALTTSVRTCSYTYEPSKILRSLTSVGNGCYDHYDAKALCSSTADCSGITIQPDYCGGAKWTLRKNELNDAAGAGIFSWVKGECSDGGVVDNANCPVGFVGLAGTDKCYQYNDHTQTHQEARNYCQALGGRLPVVESIEENAFIVKQSGWAGLVWIGFQKPTDDGAWAWEDAPTNTFTNWLNVNEPHFLPNELCSAIWTTDYNFAWNAAECDLGSVKTMCEIPRNPPPVREICEYSYHQGKILRAFTSVGTGCYDHQEAKALCSRTADCSGITIEPNHCGGAKWTLRRFELRDPATTAGIFSWKKGACSDGETEDNTDCPNGYVGLAGSNKCYHFDNNVRSQAGAKTFCQGMGGKLPVVESIQENAFIVKQSGWAGQVWIGYQKPTDNGAWAWESSPSNTFTNWLNVNEPQFLAGELCSAIWREAYNFAWNAAACDLGTVTTVCEAERVPQPTVECPAGFSLLAGTEKCYKNFPGQLGQHSWGQAKAFCEGMGAKLPVPTSDAENQFIVDQTGGVGVAWIAFSDQAQEGNWIWANGEANAYTNWIVNEPQDFIPEENCATIWTPEFQFKWNGYPCSGVRGHRNIIHTVCEATRVATCPVQYNGGCSGSRGINKYQDKAYTVAECADKCRAETEACVGFFIDNVRQECLTAKAGCTNNHDSRFKYYLIDTCAATQPEPVYDCPMTYHGGCSRGGIAIIRHLKDRAYTSTECAKLCHDEATCAGYFMGRTDGSTPVFRKSCMLVTAGCTNDGNPDWNYHAKDTCVEGTYTTVNHEVVLTGTGLDCNDLAQQLKLATATRLGVPASQINVDKSNCSRRRRLAAQVEEYRFIVQAKVASALSEDVRASLESQDFELVMSNMMQNYFETVDGAEFYSFETFAEEVQAPIREPETDNYSVPIAASAGAVGGAVLVVGAYFAMGKGRKQEATGQDRV